MQQTAAFRKAVRRQAALLGSLMVVVLVAMVLAIALPLLTHDNLHKVFGHWKFVALVLLGLAAPCVSLWLMWRDLWQMAELRVTEHRLGWVKKGKVVYAAPLAQVKASTNALLIGTQVVRFRMVARPPKSGEAMFDMDVFKRAVLARLPLENLVDDQALVWAAFRNRPLAAQLALGSVAVALLLTALWTVLR